MHEIVTSRLRLTPVDPGDAEALHQIWTHPAVRKYLWDDRVLSLEETVSVALTSQQMFADRGFGLWGAWLRDARELAGFGGYWFFGNLPDPQLLYGLAAGQWGRGLAVEIGWALVHYGFFEVGFDEIHASTDAQNVASVRVLERIGFVFSRRAFVNGLDTLYYEIPRAAVPAGNRPYALTPLKGAASC